MFRRIGALSITVLLLVSMTGPALAAGPQDDVEWSVGEDGVEVRQSSPAGIVIVVDLPGHAISSTQATEGLVPVPSEVDQAAGAVDQLVVSVEPNQLCRDAAGLVGEHWDVDALLGETGPHVPALPEIDTVPEEGEIEVDPENLVRLQEIVERALAQLEALRETLDDPGLPETDPTEDTPDEAEPWLDAAEAELELLNERLVSMIQTGREVAPAMPVEELRLVDDALDEAEAILADDGIEAPESGEVRSTVDEALTAAEGMGLLGTMGIPVVLVGTESVSQLLSEGFLPEDAPGAERDTVRENLEAAREAESAAGAAQALEDARAGAEDALAVLGPIEEEAEYQTSSPLFRQARDVASPATAALEDLVTSIEDAEEDPTEGALDDAWAYLLLAEDEVTSLVEDADAGTVSPPGQVRIFLPQQHLGLEEPNPDDVEDTDPDDVGDTDPSDLEDTDPGSGDEDPLGDPAGDDPGLPGGDDAPDEVPDDASGDPLDGSDPEDPGSVCRDGEDGSDEEDTDAEDGAEDDGGDGSDDGADGGDGGDSGDDGGDDGGDGGDGGEDGGDSGDDGGDEGGDDGGEEGGDEPFPVELSLDAEEIHTGGSEERTLTATVSNPTDETRGYQLVADDDGPFSVTTQGASEADLTPGESEDFVLRVTPIDPGEGELVVQAIEDGGSQAESIVPVTIEATEDHLRVGLSSSNLALGMDETRIVDVHVENTGTYDDEVHLSVRSPDALDAEPAGQATSLVPAGETETFEVPVGAEEPGESALEIEVEASDGSVLQSTVLVDAEPAETEDGDDAETAEGTDGSAPATKQEDANGVPASLLATLAALAFAARRAREG